MGFTNFVSQRWPAALFVERLMRVKAVPLALALMTSLAPLAEPADKTVWRVGVFDGSSGEFAGGEPYPRRIFTRHALQPNRMKGIFRGEYH
jgi:hypothetical protein